MKEGRITGEKNCWGDTILSTGYTMLSHTCSFKPHKFPFSEEKINAQRSCQPSKYPYSEVKIQRESVNSKALWRHTFSIHFVHSVLFYIFKCNLGHSDYRALLHSNLFCLYKNPIRDVLMPIS